MISDVGDGRRTLPAKLRPHGKWILAGAALTGVAALVISLILPKFYRASTYLLVSESKIGAAPLSGAWQYALLPTFVPFVDNDALIQQAIEHFHLDRPPYRLTLERFRQGDYLDVQIPKATRLLEIRVEFPDARLAADLANYLAQGSIAYNDRITASDTVATQDFLKQRMDQAATHLSAMEKRAVEVRRRSRLEDKEKTLNILLAEKESTVSNLDQLRLALVQNDDRVKTLQPLLNNEPPIIKLKKSLTSDRFLEQAVEKSGSKNADSLSVTEETVNRNREELQRQLADSTSGASAERAGSAEAKARLEQIQAEINGLLAELAADRSEVEGATRDLQLARESYESAAREYRNAALTVTAKSQELQQITPAVVPEKPVRPRILFNTLLGFLLGLMLFGGIAWLREAFRAAAPADLRWVGEEEPAEVHRR